MIISFKQEENKAVVHNLTTVGFHVNHYYSLEKNIPIKKVSTLLLMVSAF